MCSLGSCANSSRRSQTAEENHRLNEAVRTVGLISSIGLSFQKFHEAVAAFASSKAAYGWFIRVPTKGSTDRFWSTLRRGTDVAGWRTSSSAVTCLEVTRTLEF